MVIGENGPEDCLFLSVTLIGIYLKGYAKNPSPLTV